MRRSAAILVALLLVLVQALGASAAYGARCGVTAEACAKRPCCRPSTTTTQLRAEMPCCRPGSIAQGSTSSVATRDEQQAVALLSTSIATAVGVTISFAPLTETRVHPRPPRVALFLRNRSLLL